MIDTIKFKISVSDDQYKKIFQKCTIVSKKNNATSESSFVVYISDLKLGSFDRNINIFLTSTSFIYLELSLPKFAFGHNVFLIYPEDIQQVIHNLADYFNDYFDCKFLTYKKWELMRVDFCYNWKYINQQTAEYALTVLNAFNVPRKDKYSYDSSIMFKGAHLSLKFYLKKPEYFLHDFKKLKKHGFLDLAYQTLAFSEGVLRFEATLRHELLQQTIGKKLCTVADLTPEYIMTQLKKYHNQFLQFQNTTIMPLTTIYEKLSKIYKPAKAMSLFLFYCGLHSTDSEIKSIFQTKDICRNKKRKLSFISAAGVGLPISDYSDNFDVSIPSAYVTNCQTPESALRAPGVGHSPRWVM